MLHSFQNIVSVFLDFNSVFSLYIIIWFLLTVHKQIDLIWLQCYTGFFLYKLYFHIFPNHN